MSFDEEPPPESRLGPAPAPLDLGRLEVDARAAAAKHVASLLQVSVFCLMVWFHFETTEEGMMGRVSGENRQKERLRFFIESQEWVQRGRKGRGGGDREMLAAGGEN